MDGIAERMISLVERFAAPGGVAGQSYRERLPKPELQGLVSSVFVQEVAREAHPYEHRSVPNGSAEVSFLLGSRAPDVTGPHHEPDVAVLEPGSVLVGIRFRPGAAHAALGVPASELAGRRLELDRLWGRPATALLGRLVDAGSPALAADLLEQVFLDGAASAPEPDPIVAELVDRLQPWRARRVTDQASDLFLSPRQLRRRCLDAIGYGPKSLHRVLRFRGFLARIDLGEESGDLARLAVRAGYADQAHLTRECVRLSGLTPRTFLAEREASCTGSHDHSASFSQLGRALLAAGAG